MINRSEKGRDFVIFFPVVIKQFGQLGDEYFCVIGFWWGLDFSHL